MDTEIRSEILEETSERGYEFVKTMKEHDFEFEKGNYIAKKEDKKYLMKIFSGYKKKHLRTEAQTRKDLKESNFPGVDEGELFESENFVYLGIPFIENKGNMKGREQEFPDKIVNITSKLHSVPNFRGSRHYKRRFHQYPFTEENFPGTFKQFDYKTLKKIEKLFSKEFNRLEKFSQKPSHNDLNGGNIILDKYDRAILVDFEKASPNFELEDFSRTYFHNVFVSGDLFEENSLYKRILSEGIESFDLDVFSLQQALRLNEYILRHKGKTNKGKNYSSLLQKILQETFKRNLK